MEADDRRLDENSRHVASRSGSVDSGITIRAMDGFNNSAMDVDEGKGGSGLDGQSGRVHKGGRKLIYATLEERKERNRQAQATFRERRIIYVAQLEKTIQEQRDELRRLQDACSSATDERLNLKYKNSLLERILLEKGIEVWAVLDAEIPLQSKQQLKKRQPSIRRVKSTAICRKHSSITSEPMDLSEACRCNPPHPPGNSPSNVTQGVDLPNQQISERNRSLPPNIVRWQQSHEAQAASNSPTYENVAALDDNNISHLGPDTHYNHYGPPQQYHGESVLHSPHDIHAPYPIYTNSGGPQHHHHQQHLELEWSNILPSNTIPHDDDNADSYGADNVGTATHSSPISTVRTPPDYPTAGHLQQQQQQFGKSLDGASAATCFDLDAAAEVLAYHHAGYEVVQDPFGLDASLFSI